MRIAIFTSGRQDWGILLPVVRALQKSKSLTVLVIAGGMHARDGQRLTELDGCPLADFIPVLPDGDSDVAVARAAGATTTSLSAALVEHHADALLLLGDRTETLAAGLAATCLRLPIIHIHGGEETTGAIDNACRHALTQLASLHFVAHAQFAKRIITMGARRDNVFVCGAPAIDLVLTTPLLNVQQLTQEIGINNVDSPLIICTYHPTTLSTHSVSKEIDIIITGIDQSLSSYPQARLIVTRANCDAGGMVINNAFAAYANRDSRISLVSDLGVQRYWSLLAQAQVMIGNSSSGILEAPCFDLPVINIGDRQAGRLRIHDVKDVAVDALAIAHALTDCLRSKRVFSAPHATAYGDGQAASHICSAIEKFAAHQSPKQILFDR